MRCLPALLLAVVTLTAVAEPGPDSSTAPTLPDWMAGHWCAAGGIEEFWLPPDGGLMLGLNRTVVPGRPTGFEFLRIELVEAAPAYIAQPQGRLPTTFRFSDGGPHWMRFRNPQHDFPQQIEYRRSGDRLRAEISGPGKGDAPIVVVFDFQRCER